ncbi:MAG: hypothetical protein JNL87_09615 [Burkholderiaceae bacterium]|nr:hypothetical protein [Burkholderiaceae bacterium]
MSGTQRTVRHLHLTATSRAQVRSLLPRLEDALRCASLPDDGARLLVLRRLALGRLRHDIDSSALARLIERRVAEAEGFWVDAEAPAAAAADGVVFASALDARIALSLRLLRGQPAPEWYWPLAVPEAAVALTPADRVRRIARAVASSAEARAALPAWAAALVRGGAGPRLAAAIAPAEGDALLRAAGLAARPGAGAAEPARPGLGAAAPAPADWPVEPRSAVAALPVWLQSLLPEAAAPDSQPLAAAGAERPARPVRQAAAAALPARSAADEVSLPTADPLSLPADAGPAAAAAPAAPGQPPTLPARDGRSARPVGEAAAMLPPAAAGHRSDAPAAPARPLSDLPAGPAVVAGTADRAGVAAPAAEWHAVARWAEAGAATAAGGLLFLLPLLARLGLPGWRAPQGDSPAFTAAVLHAALRRLGSTDDDPAWALVQAGAPAVVLPRGSAASPAVWSDARLAPRGAPPGAMAQRLIDAPDARAQATLWLDACRRWLRRVGGIGLASLVLRPGRLALTATHADVFFELAQTDLRVRRLGLDIDPLWLPWFGRVVAFHYRPMPR